MDNLTAEHDALLRQTEELQREHDALEDTPDPDGTLHAEHKAKLRTKILELQEHMRRLAESRGSRDV